MNRRYFRIYRACPDIDSVISFFDFVSININITKCFKPARIPCINRVVPAIRIEIPTMPYRIFLRKPANTCIVVTRAKIQCAADFVIIFSTISERVSIGGVDVLLFAESIIGLPPHRKQFAFGGALSVFSISEACIGSPSSRFVFINSTQVIIKITLKNYFVECFSELLPEMIDKIN